MTLVLIYIFCISDTWSFMVCWRGKWGIVRFKKEERHPQNDQPLIYIIYIYIIFICTRNDGLGSSGVPSSLRNPPPNTNNKAHLSPMGLLFLIAVFLSLFLSFSFCFYGIFPPLFLFLSLFIQLLCSPFLCPWPLSFDYDLQLSLSSSFYPFALSVAFSFLFLFLFILSFGLFLFLSLFLFRCLFILLVYCRFPCPFLLSLLLVVLLSRSLFS